MAWRLTGAAAACLKEDATCSESDEVSDASERAAEGLRSRDRDGDMDPLRSPVSLQRGDPERAWRATFSGLGTGRGATGEADRGRSLSLGAG